MVEERRFEGYWWLPEHPENKVGGVLTYSPTEGARLRLFSALDADPEKRESDEAVEFSTVLGRSTDNEEITVKSTIRDEWNVVDVGDTTVMTAEHTSLRMYCGAHLTEDPQFVGLRISYPRLYGWFGKTGTESDVETTESEEPVFIERYQRPDPAIADLDEFELRVEPQTTHSSSSGLHQRNEDAAFVIDSRGDGFSFNDSWEIARSLQSFLTLACGEETYFEELIGILDDGITEVETLSSRSNYGNSSGEFDINQYTFEFSDIENRFSELIGDWFKMSDELEPVLSLYFATQYNSNLYIQNEFLSLARAIESFHRIEYDGLYIPESEFDDYYDELVADIPSEYSQSFTDHLKDGTFKYANEYSLRKRLNELEDDFGELFSHLPIDFSEKISPIVGTRNDLTHPDAERESPSPEELIHYADVLHVLLEMVLLKNLHIPDGKIKERTAIRYAPQLELNEV